MPTFLPALANATALGLATTVVTSLAESYQRKLAYQQAMAMIDVQRDQLKAQTRVMLSSLKQHHRAQMNALKQQGHAYDSWISGLSHQRQALQDALKLCADEIAFQGRQPLDLNTEVRLCQMDYRVTLMKQQLELCRQLQELSTLSGAGFQQHSAALIQLSQAKATLPHTIRDV